MPFVSAAKDKQPTLRVFVQPKAKRTMFLGLHDNMLKIGVTAPPVDGKANREVIYYLADFFGLKKRDVRIVAGEKSRRKICTLGHIDEHEIRKKVLSLLK